MLSPQVRQGTVLPYVEVLPASYSPGQPCSLIIGLHGYGADMHDLTGLASVLNLPETVFVFPNAPNLAFDGADVTAHAWYERGGYESPESVQEALTALDGFVQEVLARYQPLRRVVLLGFSQGGAMALRYGLPRAVTFAGLVVLSGSLRRLEDLVPGLPAHRQQAIFIAHGRADQVVPLEVSQKLITFLNEQGYRPMARFYPMGHQISPSLLTDLRGWLHKVLAPEKASPSDEKRASW